MPLPRPARPPPFLLILGALAPAAATAASPGDRLQRALGPRATVSEHRETGRVRFVGSAPGRPLPRPRRLAPLRAAPADVARAFLDAQWRARSASATGVSSARDLEPATPGGRHGGALPAAEHEGVPVLGGELVVNLDARRQRALGRRRGAARRSTCPTPPVGAADARGAAIDGRRQGRTASPPPRSTPRCPSCGSTTPSSLAAPGRPAPRLVWRIDVDGRSQPIDELVLVDASAGQRRPARSTRSRTPSSRDVCDAEQHRVGATTRARRAARRAHAKAGPPPASPTSTSPTSTPATPTTSSSRPRPRQPRRRRACR